MITRNNRVAFQLEPMLQFDRDSMLPVRGSKTVRGPSAIRPSISTQPATSPNLPPAKGDEEVLAAASLLNESLADHETLRLVVEEDGHRVRVVRRRVVEESLD